MKSVFFPLLLGVALLAGCQSSSVNTASDSRTFDLPGTQARTTITVPADQAAVSTETPYSLRGDSSPQGGTAFDPSAYRGHSTNGF